MKRKFFATLSVFVFTLVLVAGGHAQSKSANIENLSTANKTETHIYDKKGKLLYTVYRYDATELPKDVRSLVTREYYDYDIAGVEEVKVPGNEKSTYFVHVQDDSKLKIVRVYNGETELVKEYKRG